MPRVLFSFDIEEFDMPEEYGHGIPFDRQIGISSMGTSLILDLLQKHKVNATFFSTVVFASNAKPQIDRLLLDGHELASHGYYHSKFETSHLKESRIELGKLTGNVIKGYRMARMMPVDENEIRRAGYSYNSSLNPVYLPGRYNNLGSPRTRHQEYGITQLPASATPLLRIPLFWLTFHNVPLTMYMAMCRQVIKRDGYLNLYFHPWEFTDLRDKQLGMPWYVRKNSGKEMEKRFDQLISWMKDENYSFSTISEFLEGR